MTYSTGGNIQASDYNALATLTGGMNQVFADLHPGETTLPLASFGYGQTPPLAPVAIDEPVTSVQWSDLFNTMRRCGVHQGTPVVPPLPGTPPYSNTNPVPADPVIAYTGLDTLASTLGTNRFELAPGNSSLTIGTTFTQGVVTQGWVNSLTFNYQVNFGSWNNARYFFNSGGKLQLNGYYVPLPPPHVVTTDESQFMNMLASMRPLVFDYNSTTPYSGVSTPIGFYNATNPSAWDTLTTSYQTIYNKMHGGSYYYSASYIKVQAKLADAPGTNGIIDFTIEMVDAEPVLMKHPKTGTTSYRVDIISATGSAVHYGGIHTVVSVGPYGGFAKA